MKVLVEPKDRRAVALASPKCVYSVSLSTDESRYKRMLKGYAWTLKHFENITIYLGDGPLLQTTLQVLGLPCEHSAQRAAAIAAQTKADLDEISSRAPGHDLRVSYFCASDAESKIEFTPIHEELQQSYRLDSAIRASIDEDAESYIARLHFRNRLGMNRVLAHAKAVEYLIFEIAGYVLLSKSGLAIDVYASGSGELPTLRKFMTGELTGFPDLAARSCIVLKS